MRCSTRKFSTRVELFNKRLLELLPGIRNLHNSYIQFGQRHFSAHSTEALNYVYAYVHETGSLTE